LGDITVRNHFRRGARFIADARQHCRPLDRNERAKILFMAEQLERRTRSAGGRNGVVSEIGLRVLRALLLRFHRGTDGYCAPSYTVLQAVTGLCRQSIANALSRLEAAGILRITRRLVRETVGVDGFLMRICRQGSNLYSVHEPSERADRLPVRAPAGRSFPGKDIVRALAHAFRMPSLRDRGKSTGSFQNKSEFGGAAAM
jgi:hypothetical protein